MTTRRLTLQQRTDLRALRQFPAALAPPVVWAKPPTPHIRETEPVDSLEASTTPSEGSGDTPAESAKTRGSRKAEILNAGGLG